MPVSEELPTAATAPVGPSHLAEERNLLERIQRYDLEDDATKQHQQNLATMTSQQAMMSIPGSRDAVALDQEHLTRLLQLQQLSDEDIIPLVSEFQSTQNAALHKSLDYSKKVALEQQLMEARLLRSGLPIFQRAKNDDLKQDLNMINHTNANAAIAHRFLARAKKPGGQASPLQQAGMTQ